jgi:Periplasmic binding protein
MPDSQRPIPEILPTILPASDKPEVQEFVAAYKSRYGLVPTQRSFFVFEATYLVVDAIRRAGSDKPDAIKQALKTTTMPSRLRRQLFARRSQPCTYAVADRGIAGWQAGRDRYRIRLGACLIRFAFGQRPDQ